MIGAGLFRGFSQLLANLGATAGASLIGYIQGVGATARTVQDRLRDAMGVQDFGADATGAADSSAAIVAAFDAAQTANRAVTIGGQAFKLAAAVALPYHVPADWGGATIDATTVAAATYAVTIKNKSGVTNLQRPSMWRGLDLKVAAGGYGVKIEAPDGQWSVEDLAAESWRVKGGARGIGFGQNTWLVNFRNVHVTGQTEIGIDGTTGHNAGEGISFYAGAIANVKNGTTSGIGFLQDYNPADAGGGTFKYFGTSFDYSDVQIHHRHGLLELHGCHIEGDGANPLVKVEQVAGRSVISFHALGSTWVNNPASTRTSVLEVTGNAVVDIHGGQCTAIGNTEGLEFVKVVPGGTPAVSIRGVDFNLFPNISGTFGRICGHTSLVRNGDFEAGTLDGWGMDAVNFLRNGAFVGGVDGVIGAGGQWPTNMALVGALNGLNQPTLTFTTVNGRPVMKVRFQGVPTATTSTGFYFDNSTNIASAQGDLWTQRCYLRTVGAAVGVNGYSLQITERAAGGGALVSGSTAVAVGQLRQRFDFSYTVTQATAAYVHPVFQFTFTNGVAVDVTFEVDIPSLMLRPMVYADIIRNDPAAALPTYRTALDTVNGRTAAKALKLYSTAAESVGVYASVPVKSREWLMARGYVKVGAVAAGGAGLKVSWRDALDAEISAQNMRGDGTYKTVVAGHVQHSGVRVAPTGAERARLQCWLEAFNGTAYFDDVEAWTI